MKAKSAEIKVDSVRKIFDDGNHNGFTDMCRFRSDIYLVFRSSPTGHAIRPDSRIVVLRSRDGAEWEQAFSFNVPLRDVRDPHFLIFRDKLFIYVGAWLCNPATPGVSDINDHLGYAVWTGDGKHWEGPRSLEGTYGHYIWRTAAYGGKAYLCGRRVRDFTPTDGEEGKKAVMESALLESEDGLIWKWTGLFQEVRGNETAFLFEDDGSILAVARSLGRGQLCKSRPPYRDWTRTDLGRFIGGPLIVKWAGRYLVGGRKLLTPDIVTAKVDVWIQRREQRSKVDVHSNCQWN
ncbi:MAG: hypothetical protein WCP55_21890 [Lentisphaerota bacterium]